MANKFLGEITAELHGETYTLRIDFNAMCAFEEATGVNAMLAIAQFESGEIDFRTMRALVHAALVQVHPKAEVTVAGAMLSEDMNLVGALVAAAFPDAEKDAPSGNTRAGKAKA